MTETEIYQIAKRAAKDGVKEALSELMLPYVTKKDAAQMIGVSERTLHRMVWDGRIKVASNGKISREEIFRIQNQ